MKKCKHCSLDPKDTNDYMIYDQETEAKIVTSKTGAPVLEVDVKTGKPNSWKTIQIGHIKFCPECGRNLELASLVNIFQNLFPDGSKVFFWQDLGMVVKVKQDDTTHYSALHQVNTCVEAIRASIEEVKADANVRQDDLATQGQPK